jgi:hypothetical protein
MSEDLILNIRQVQSTHSETLSHKGLPANYVGLQKEYDFQTALEATTF